MIYTILIARSKKSNTSSIIANTTIDIVLIANYFYAHGIIMLFASDTMFLRMAKYDINSCTHAEV